MVQTCDNDGDEEAEVEAEVDPEVEVEAESEGEGLMSSGDGICNKEGIREESNGITKKRGNGIGTLHNLAFGNPMKQRK